MAQEQNEKICPLLYLCSDICTPTCVKEQCAWWNEDRQKCAMAVTPPRK